MNEIANTKNRTAVREIHGVTWLPNASRDGEDCAQEVRIRDRNGVVHLDLLDQSKAAVLTPDRARYLADQLYAAAERVEVKP